MGTHTGENSYFCKVCGSAYFHSNQLKDHMQMHFREKPYSCDVYRSGS